MHTSNLLGYFLRSPIYHFYEENRGKSEQLRSDGKDVPQLLLPLLRRPRMFGISKAADTGLRFRNCNAATSVRRYRANNPGGGGAIKDQ